MKIKLFKNYGVLASEKRNVYTYGMPNGTATCWDEIDVEIPEELIAGENCYGNLLVEFPDSPHCYPLNDVLAGNKKPEFRYINKDGNLKIIKLEEELNTLSYILGQNDTIETGKIYFFGQLWDGDGDGDELLESGAIAVYQDGEEHIVDFEVVETDEDVLKAIVRVTDID